MGKILLTLISIPKSVFFNFRYLPLSQAIRLPFMLTYNTRFSVKGSIQIEGDAHFGMIRIGFHKVPVCNVNDRTAIIVGKGASLCFLGAAHIGNGSKLHVAENASLSLGDEFAISASSAINCYKSIKFGRDIQFSWNCLVMDSDTHSIFDQQGTIMNAPESIEFGDKVWVGCNCTILKGARIPSNCVIGANSVVTGHCFQKNTIIASNPAKTLKEIGSWEL